MIEGAFNSFVDQDVNLSPDTYRFGRQWRDYVIQRVEAESGERGFPELLLGESFGAGSFGRKTKEQPLDDIDIYFVMSGGGLTMKQGDARVPVELHGSGSGVLATDPLLLDGQWVSSARILARVAERVTEFGYESGVNTQGKSAYMKVSDTLNIDICPVLWASSTIGEVDRYYLPAGTGSYSWKKTDPRLDQARVTADNQTHSEKLLPVIRLMKWWNDNRNVGLQNKGWLKGIHLEVIVSDALRGRTIDGIAPTMHVLFAELPALLDRGCPDPTGLGAALDVNLSSGAREHSKIALDRDKGYAALAANALAANNGSGALQYWRNVFPI